MPRTPVPRCPGCRYDLSGQLPRDPARPGSSCPLRTVCPECGEPVAWSRRAEVNAWDGPAARAATSWGIFLLLIVVLALPCCLCGPFMAFASWISETGW
ncbi:MAG: hypothetical protein ACF8Q5_01685 [Phycisphaerales bacterium JB040]